MLRRKEGRNLERFGVVQLGEEQGTVEHGVWCTRLRGAAVTNCVEIRLASSSAVILNMMT